MKKMLLIFAVLFSSIALADDVPLFMVDGKGINTEQDWTFMEVHVLNHDKSANEKFFIGPLPEIGQAVEMVYVGSRESGSMRFMLRTKK